MFSVIAVLALVGWIVALVMLLGTTADEYAGRQLLPPKSTKAGPGESTAATPASGASAGH